MNSIRGIGKNKHTKKIRNIAIFFGVICIAISCFFMLNTRKKKNIMDRQINLQSESKSNSNKKTNHIVTKEHSESNIKVKQNKKAVNKNEWNLILANPYNSLPKGFKPKTDTVQGGYVMDYRAAIKARKMIADAEKDGISLIVCSAYRSEKYQKNLFEQQIKKNISSGKSREDAVAVAATVVAPPGTSEHQTGLALDIVTNSYQQLEEEFEKTDAFKWLNENSYKYGFILRYPKEKESITKIIYEPWHYRYVGEEHAKKIKQQNICLEEYLLNK